MLQFRDQIVERVLKQSLAFLRGDIVDMQGIVG